MLGISTIRIYERLPNSKGLPDPMQILEGGSVAFCKYFPTILIDKRRHAHIRSTVDPDIASSQAVHG